MSETMLSQAGPESRGNAVSGPASPSAATGLSNVECRCPVEAEFHQWRFIHTELLHLKVQDVYKLVFVHEKFMLDVLAGRKTYKYVAGDWAKDPETGAFQRTLTYTMSFSYGKSSNVTETQVLSEHNRAGEAYVVLNEVCNEGVPLADNFSIMVHICLLRAAAPADEPALPASGDWCRYSCYSQIKYKKTVWGMIKGQLERSAYGGMEGVHKDVAAALKNHGLGAASTESGHTRMASVQQAKRKRRTRTISTDFSLRLQKDLPGKGDATNWSSLLINIFLLVLIGVLLLANFVLYSKVESLEAYATQVSSVSGSKERSESGETATADYFCNDDTAKRISSLFEDPEGGVWVRVSRVLARQEELYFTELEEFRLHLNGASKALLEVHTELREVLKRLPKTMDHLMDVVATELEVEMNGRTVEEEPSTVKSTEGFDGRAER